MREYKFGLDTFGDITLKDDGTLDTVSQTIRNTVEHGILADNVGIDSIGIGEASIAWEKTQNLNS